MEREEVAQRLERFRASTLELLRVVHGRSNVRYLTGYDGGGFTPWLLIADDSVSVVHYTADEDSIAALTSLDMKAFPFGPADDPLAVLLGAIRRRSQKGVTADLDWWSHAELDGLGFAPENCSEHIRRLRVVKSEWEQDRLREAGSITTRAMDRLEALAREGALPRDLGAAVYETTIQLGSGPFNWIPYIAVGDATFVNHATWDRGGEVEDSYLFEFAASVDGYGTPLSRSWVANEKGCRALAAVEQGVQQIRDALCPGAKPGVLHGLMSGSIEDAGFHFAHRAGYSIGLGETETWMEGNLAVLGPRADYPIEAGMAFHVVGSVVEPGRFGVARSNSLLVTDDGCEVLSR